MSSDALPGDAVSDNSYEARKQVYTNTQPYSFVERCKMGWSDFVMGLYWHHAVNLRVSWRPMMQMHPCGRRWLLVMARHQRKGLRARLSYR